MLECLLKHGGDPNLVFEGLSAWQVLLVDALGVPVESRWDWPARIVLYDRTVLARNWWSAVPLMMHHGADMDSELLDLDSIQPRNWKWLTFLDLAGNRKPRKIIKQRKRFLGLEETL